MTWLYSVIIGCIPLSSDHAYTYLGATRLRLCFIDFAATSGGSSFAALLLCAVVGPSLIAVSICYFHIFIAARIQAQRIYDVELAAAAASRRVSSSPMVLLHTREVGSFVEVSVSGFPFSSRRVSAVPVSYTHLTLPTIYSV